MDPIKRKQLYDHLSSEGMTTLDFDTFSKEYSENKEKQDKLYVYLKDNGMTSLDGAKFSTEYFGDLQKKKVAGVSPSKDTSSDSYDSKGKKVETPFDAFKQGPEVGPITPVLEPVTVEQKDKNTKDEIAKIKAIPKVEEQQSYLSNLLNNQLASGSVNLGVMFSSLPETIYSAFAMPQNFIAWATGADIETSPDKLKKLTGTSNPILDLYLEEQKEAEKRKEEYNKKYEETSAYENFKKGNYKDGFELLGSGFIESLPVSLSMMAGGAALGSAGKLASYATPVFAGSELVEMDKDNPEMPEWEKTLKAFGSAGAETVFSAIGEGTIGKVYKDILLREGTEKGAVIFKEGLIDMYKRSLEKYGILAGMAGEGLEEGATQVTQNLIKGRPALEGLADAVLQGSAGGAVFSAPLSVRKANEFIQNGITEKKVNKIVETSDYSTVSEAFNDKNVENLDNSQIKLAETKNSETILRKKLAQDTKNGLLTSDEAKNIFNNFSKVKSITSAIEKIELTDNQKTKAVNLLSERTAIENKIEGVEKALIGKEIERIKEINETLANIREEDQFESLPTEQKTPLLEEASKQLIAEKEAAGIKEYSLTETEIANRAKENLEKEATPVSKEEEKVTPKLEEAPVREKKAYDEKLNRPATLNSIGDSKLETPLEGTAYVEGQQVVFEDESGTIHELGNVDELSDIDVSYEESKVDTNNEGNITFEGNPIAFGKSDIKFDKKGNITRVVARNEDGSITTTLRGNNAVDVAYQYALKEAQKPENINQVNENLEQDEEFKSDIAKSEKEQSGVTPAVTETTTSEVPVKSVGEQKSTEVAQPITKDRKVVENEKIAEIEAKREKALLRVEDGSKYNEGIEFIENRGDEKIRGVSNNETVNGVRDMLVTIDELLNLHSEHKDVYEWYKGLDIEEQGKWAGKLGEINNNDVNIEADIFKIDILNEAKRKALLYVKRNTVEGLKAERAERQKEVNAKYDAELKALESKPFENKVEDEVNQLRDLVEGLEIETEQETGQKEKIRVQAEKARKSLSQFDPDITVELHETQQEYNNATGTGVSQGDNGEYDPNTKTIYINMEKATNTTVGHEAFHALIFETIRNIFPNIKGEKLNKLAKEATGKMLSSVMRTLNKKSDLYKQLVDIVGDVESNYEEILWNEEKMAEFFGVITNNADQIDKTVFSYIQEWINTLARAMGFAPLFKEAQNDFNTLDLLRRLSIDLSEGNIFRERDIENISEIIPKEIQEAVDEAEIILSRKSKVSEVFKDNPKLSDIGTVEQSGKSVRTEMPSRKQLTQGITSIIQLAKTNNMSKEAIKEYLLERGYSEKLIDQTLTKWVSKNIKSKSKQYENTAQAVVGINAAMNRITNAYKQGAKDKANTLKEAKREATKIIFQNIQGKINLNDLKSLITKVRDITDENYDKKIQEILNTTEKIFDRNVTSQRNKKLDGLIKKVRKENNDGRYEKLSIKELRSMITRITSLKVNEVPQDLKAIYSMVLESLANYKTTGSQPLFNRISDLHTRLEPTLEAKAEVMEMEAEMRLEEAEERAEKREEKEVEEKEVYKELVEDLLQVGYNKNEFNSFDRGQLYKLYDFLRKADLEALNVKELRRIATQLIQVGIGANSWMPMKEVTKMVMDFEGARVTKGMEVESFAKNALSLGEAIEKYILAFKPDANNIDKEIENYDRKLKGYVSALSGLFKSGTFSYGETVGLLVAGVAKVEAQNTIFAKKFDKLLRNVKENDFDTQLLLGLYAIEKRKLGNPKNKKVFSAKEHLIATLELKKGEVTPDIQNLWDKWSTAEDELDIPKIEDYLRKNPPAQALVDLIELELGYADQRRQNTGRTYEGKVAEALDSYTPIPVRKGMKLSEFLQIKQATESVSKVSTGSANKDLKATKAEPIRLDYFKVIKSHIESSHEYSVMMPIMKQLEATEKAMNSSSDKNLQVWSRILFGGFYDNLGLIGRSLEASTLKLGGSTQADKLFNTLKGNVIKSLLLSGPRFVVDALVNQATTKIMYGRQMLKGKSNRKKHDSSKGKVTTDMWMSEVFSIYNVEQASRIFGAHTTDAKGAQTRVETKNSYITKNRTVFQYINDILGHNLINRTTDTGLELYYRFSDQPSMEIWRAYFSESFPEFDQGAFMGKNQQDYREANDLKIKKAIADASRMTRILYNTPSSIAQKVLTVQRKHEGVLGEAQELLLGFKYNEYHAWNNAMYSLLPAFISKKGDMSPIEAMKAATTIATRSIVYTGGQAILNAIIIDAILGYFGESDDEDWDEKLAIIQQRSLAQFASLLVLGNKGAYAVAAGEFVVNVINKAMTSRFGDKDKYTPIFYSGQIGIDQAGIAGMVIEDLLQISSEAFLVLDKTISGEPLTEKDKEVLMTQKTLAAILATFFGIKYNVLAKAIDKRKKNFEPTKGAN